MEEVRAKKSLGQHFLKDRNIANRICCSLQVPSQSQVLEIGCGTGVLTSILLERDEIVLWGAEVDQESIEYLHKHFPSFTPRLMHRDFLEIDLNGMFPSGVHIIGNFPYNISSQIFFRIIEFRNTVPQCVCMIQKEVAERIAEKPGSRTYGILSVLLQAWYDIEYLFTVSEHVFCPPPKVKSAVIRLKRNSIQTLNCDEKLFIQVVKAAFAQRRKMLRNCMHSRFGALNGEEHRFFSHRAEQLSVADFAELTSWISARI